MKLLFMQQQNAAKSHYSLDKHVILFVYK